LRGQSGHGERALDWHPQGLGETRPLVFALPTFTQPAAWYCSGTVRARLSGLAKLANGLYMVDGTPPANGSPQAMKDFQSNWNVS
jgi:hypothetical protein